MSTSLWGGRILYDGTKYDNNEAFDTAFARVLVNNALHLADEAAQVRIAYPPTQNGYGVGGTAVDSTSATRERLAATFGPFPVHIRDDGSPYKFRVSMRARVKTAATAVTFKTVIHPPGVYLSDTTGDNVVSATCNSTTSSWLTNTTDNLAVLGPFDSLAGYRRIGSVDPSGNAISVGWTLLQASVFVIATTGTPGVELTGFYVSEYIGV